MSWNDISDECLVHFLRGISKVTFLVSASGYSIDIDEWTKLTGQNSEQVRGLGWTNVLHKDDALRAHAAWQTAVTHGTSYNTDYRIRCTDGIYRWFNARAEPVLNEDGDVIHWVGMILAIAGSKRFNTQDITEENFEDISPAALRAARAMLNWSAEKLAEESGISRSTVRRLENDDSHISARRSNIISILDAFQGAGLVLTGELGVVTGVSEGAKSPSDAAPMEEVLPASVVRINS